jgi:hypothetical protein
LFNIASLDAQFRSKFGRSANTLSELSASTLNAWPENAVPSDTESLSLTKGFNVQYECTPQGMHAYIPKQADLPGFYLVRPEGVYFSESNPPTTNDHQLSRFAFK